MAGVAGLEPVTSAVTGQRSKPIELHPRIGEWQHRENHFPPSTGNCQKKRFGRQTPRRWGWRTPLKKRAVTRIKILQRTGSNSPPDPALSRGI